MTKYIRTFMVSVVAVVVLGGCAETTLPQASGKGTIDTINAMPGSPAIGFLIEERRLGNVGYKSALGGQSFDDLTYNFNFELTVLGDDSPTRIATHFLDVMADTNHTLVLTGSVAAPVVTQWERPAREWEGSETVFEIAFGHLSPALGDVDLYAAPVGTAPVLGEERAKLSYGDRVPEIDLESDEYEIILTARDDPATILYQSHGTVLAARISYLVAIFDADPSITGNISVRAISEGGGSQELPDSNFLPTLRTVHAAFGSENFDIYRDQDFTAPIFSDLGFSQSTGDIPVGEGIVSYTYTTVGDPNAILNDETQLIARGLRTSTIVAGQPGGELARLVIIDNRRPIDTHAKLRLLHAAFNHQLMDLYLVETGTDINDENPLIADLSYSFTSDFAATIAGNYDLILTLPDDKNPIFGPAPLNLANGDVVEIVFVDTADPLIPGLLETRF